jgi:anti-sigma-K factor RskA
MPRVGAPPDLKARLFASWARREERASSSAWAVLRWPAVAAATAAAAVLALGLAVPRPVARGAEWVRMHDAPAAARVKVVDASEPGLDLFQAGPPLLAAAGGDAP